MKRRTRIRYTDSQKAVMWDRWRQGESLHQIARLFDRHHSSVRGILAETGGIRPPTRRRSPLVERSTRYVMLVKVDRKDTQTVVDALIRTARKLPNELYKSLTWDRGKEMADHRRFTLATDIQVYVCDPQSPWQRGSNENTNGLLRQYFPKGIDLSAFSQAKLNEVARKLNERPRKTLGFETPIERYRQAVALTG